MACTSNNDCTKYGAGWYCANNGRCQKNKGKFKGNKGLNVKRAAGKAKRTGMRAVTNFLGKGRQLASNPNKKQKKKLKRTNEFRNVDYNIEEEDEFMEMGCRTNADCTSGNCENGKCVRFKPSFGFGQKKPRRKSTRETYAQQSEKRIQKKSEEINNREITRIVELSRKKRTQKESQELNRLLNRHPEIKRKKVGRQAIIPGSSFPKLKF